MDNPQIENGKDSNSSHTVTTSKLFVFARREPKRNAEIELKTTEITQVVKQQQTRIVKIIVACVQLVVHIQT